jgi:hypothetical protein
MQAFFFFFLYTKTLLSLALICSFSYTDRQTDYSRLAVWVASFVMDGTEEIKSKGLGRRVSETHNVVRFGHFTAVVKRRLIAFVWNQQNLTGNHTRTILFVRLVLLR